LNFWEAVGSAHQTNCLPTTTNKPSIRQYIRVNPPERNNYFAILAGSIALIGCPKLAFGVFENMDSAEIADHQDVIAGVARASELPNLPVQSREKFTDD